MRAARCVLLLLTVLTMVMARSAPAQATDPPVTASFYAPEPELRTYVEEALRRDPRISEALARYRGALQVVPQVGALPEPMVTFTQAVRSVETRLGPQLQTVMLTQAFPWFGTLDLRERVAVEAAVVSYHQWVATQRDVIGEVKRAYYELAYVDAAIAITAQEQSLLEHYEQLAQTRFSTGQGLQQGVIRLQAEITQLINRLQGLEQHRSSWAARLNTLRDRPPEAPVPPVPAPARPDVELNLEALYDLGDRYRPELQAGTARIQRSERAIALASTTGRPRFTLGVGFQNILGRRDPAGRLMPPPDNGKNALALSVGVTLPLRSSKYRAAVQEAGEHHYAERDRLRADRNAMEFAVRDAVVRIDTLRDQLALFEGVLIPQTEETLRATEAAYETAQLGVLDLVDGERMRLEVRLVAARCAADYLLALAELERATGTMVPVERRTP